MKQPVMPWATITAGSLSRPGEISVLTRFFGLAASLFLEGKFSLHEHSLFSCSRPALTISNGIFHATMRWYD